MTLQILKNKYLGIKALTQVSRTPRVYQFWYGLMKVKDDFFCVGDSSGYVMDNLPGYGRIDGL